MLTLECKACGEGLSASDETCPACGAPVRGKRLSAAVYFVLGLLAVALLARAIDMAETGVHGLSTYSPFR